jgi:gamma-glutamyl:cysteine ligase YbdK (ATP-grasp superfamily)
METAHSKTNRAKKPASKIVVNQWDDVWRSFKDNSEYTTIEAMNADGWKTVDQVMKITGLSNSRIRNMISEEKFDREKKRVKDGGTIKTMNFVRPKATTYQ